MIFFPLGHPPGDIWQHVGTLFPTGIQLVEARDAAKYRALYKTVTHTHTHLEREILTNDMVLKAKSVIVILLMKAKYTSNNLDLKNRDIKNDRGKRLTTWKTDPRCLRSINECTAAEN